MEIAKMGLTQEQESIIQLEIDRLNEEIKTIKRRSEIESLLYTSGARNIKACSALIEDRRSEDSRLFRQDIEDQIKALKADEKTSFLFYNSKADRKSFIPAESLDRKNRQLTYEELCRIM